MKKTENHCRPKAAMAPVADAQERAWLTHDASYKKTADDWDAGI